MNATTAIDPQAATQLRLIADFMLGEADADIEAQRQKAKALIGQMSHHQSHGFEGEITNAVVNDGKTVVPVRRYVPANAASAAGIVYFHGGGWVFGGLDTGERFARALARTTGVTVVSVDYRRAPEHAYPAALVDCLVVANSAFTEFGRWCAVVGDSAGGNLAAAVTVALAGTDRAFGAQLLLYPCLDASMSGASYQEFADGYGLTRDTMQYYWNAYAGDRPRNDSLLSPLAAKSLGGLPTTIIVAAGFDVLRDEGVRFAQRLVASSIPTVYLPFATLPHGFIDLVDQVDAARQGLGEVLSIFKTLLPAAPVAIE